MEDQREIALQAWCEAQTGLAQQALQSVSGDASFRRYFRVQSEDNSLIAVDCPPQQEPLLPFLAIAEAYAQGNIPVPQVLAVDIEKGFMLQSDLGQTLLLSKLRRDNMRQYYAQALAMLPAIMRVQETADGPLPAYNEALLTRELNLFHDWLLEQQLSLTLDARERQLWGDFCQQMIDNALQQPTVGVHRDYHSRNLMVQPDHSLAVIDFQDAVCGPITYDAVSLLRDCYIEWPDAWVDELAQQLRTNLQAEQILASDVSATDWQRWFDYMGLQRHTKAAGIFARLAIRDGKDGYLNDVPRTLSYMIRIAARYPALQPFQQWLQRRVWPLVANMR
ncbi:aminoglycoside phosphotransferase family protein [Idiomarina xiamenensis]|uniref:Phosphotransferase n=1 Tax=Idiomarina xiamenensis 10-D-4 TaxID=740709 RepID=K2KY32_9GAMM|nr:phosphotransferase [Idiomarina xiamenensis]EKE87479.1 phosphotransferase [Idiomarina xiamenensis 10-D-4]